MEGFNMNDWVINEEDWDEDEGRYYKHLSYKHSEGQKHYNAWYWSPEEIYFEVWILYKGRYEYVEGGIKSWNEALEFDIVPVIEEFDNQ